MNTLDLMLCLVTQTFFISNHSISIIYLTPNQCWFFFASFKTGALIPAVFVLCWNLLGVLHFILWLNIFHLLFPVCLINNSFYKDTSFGGPEGALNLNCCQRVRLRQGCPELPLVLWQWGGAAAPPEPLPPWDPGTGGICSGKEHWANPSQNRHRPCLALALHVTGRSLRWQMHWSLCKTPLQKRFLL